MQMLGRDACIEEEGGGEVDDLTAQQRSYCMSRIRSVDTQPERLVRECVHGLGLRFCLHCRRLPGKPDVVLPRHRKVIFVHGCFWHMHYCRRGRVVPKTNRRYWALKRKGNVRRNHDQITELKRLGWDVLVVWECWTRNPHLLKQRLGRFLARSRAARGKSRTRNSGDAPLCRGGEGETP